MQSEKAYRLPLVLQIMAVTHSATGLLQRNAKPKILSLPQI
jgi:hypothetical protein